MRNNINTRVLLLWPFYLSLCVLILNDHVLKQAYPGWITGKLSDFSGIFLLTLILYSIFSRHKWLVNVFIIISFSLWKSAYSQPFIDTFNSYSPMLITRVVDLTDLIALCMIPLAHYVFTDGHRFTLKLNLLPLLKIPVIAITSFALMATSRAPDPHDKYIIYTVNPEQTITTARAVDMIGIVADENGLECIRCEQHAKSGEYRDRDITLIYEISKDSKQIHFDVKGSSGSLLFGGGSWGDMEVIQQELLELLNSEIGPVNIHHLSVPGRYY